MVQTPSVRLNRNACGGFLETENVILKCVCVSQITPPRQLKCQLAAIAFQKLMHNKLLYCQQKKYQWRLQFNTQNQVTLCTEYLPMTQLLVLTNRKESEDRCSLALEASLSYITVTLLLTRDLQATAVSPFIVVRIHFLYPLDVISNRNSLAVLLNRMQYISLLCSKASVLM